MQNKNIYEIVFKGRGGQGIVTLAQLTAEALFECGFNDIKVIPTYGAERRGAPVETNLKCSNNNIYELTPSNKLDYIVFLDSSLFKEEEIIKRIKEDYYIIVNTDSELEYKNLAGEKIIKIDITGIALKNKLLLHNRPIINTPILGAFSEVSGLFTITEIKKVIEKNFKKDEIEINLRTIEEVISEVKNVFKK
ncbi:MAG TPA: 2-oxoacid:acceptor oxidoreductase family protein [bacterium]|nr:2-oxoacid:acceptor oxidoreductase family protein [bacterium]HPQ19427.1 2-oxoacid:acceptor oxidoreductase family protein [bacterium]